MPVYYVNVEGDVVAFGACCPLEPVWSCFSFVDGGTTGSAGDLLRHSHAAVGSEDGWMVEDMVDNLDDLSCCQEPSHVVRGNLVVSD